MSLFGSISEHSVPRRLIRGAATIALAFFLSAALLRISPGWNADATDMDMRLSSSSVDELRRERAETRNLFRFYTAFAMQVIYGDAVHSEVFGRPVTELIADRAGATTRSVVSGLFSGWVLAVLIAVATSRTASALGIAGAASASAALLACPSALLAIACLVLGLPPAIAIAAVVFPRLFPHAHEQFRLQVRAPHVVMARARGVSGFRLFCGQILPGALPPLAALAGASVPLAFGAAIPIEALTDFPGLGQLTWQAALGRDMPLLVSLTLLLTIVSVAANLVAEIIAPARRVQRI